MINLDDFQAEHEAEKNAKLEAERLAKEQAEREQNEAWAAKQKEAREARAHATFSIRAAIANAVTLLQPSWDVEFSELDGYTFKVGGHQVALALEEQYTSSASSWKRGKPLGTYAVVVGGYGDRTRYPALKAGGHNYGKIAEKIVGLINHKLAVAETEAKRRANLSAAGRLQAEFGLRDWGCVRASAVPTLPVMIDFKSLSNRNMTIDQARKLLVALKEAGCL